MMFNDEHNSFSTFQNSLLHNPQNKVDYAIISAMPEELEFFFEEFAQLNFSIIKIGEFDFKIYDYQNSKILLAHTGFGTAFAASVFTLIHAYCHPEYFLISGTAGGIKDGLQLRDVVIAERAFEAEIQDAFTILKNTPFESALTHPIKNKCFPAQYSASAELLEICDSIHFENLNVQRGTVVTSNAFPAPLELFEKIKCFAPYSIDMETSAFYQTAWLLNAKVLAVRGISNILNTDGTDEKIHEADLKGSSLAASQVLLTILNKILFLKNQAKHHPSDTLEDEARHLMNEYQLQPHPEGGYFAAIYKSTDRVNSTDQNKYGNESRSAGTSIYYFLDKHDYSAWHSLKSDEIWHFYSGSALKIYVIDEHGKLATYLLGNPLQTKGASFQVIIKADNYFAAENLDKSAYSFVGCTVSPGFEYKDFQIATQATLFHLFPQHHEMIAKLSHSSTLTPSNICKINPKSGDLHFEKS